MVPRQNPITTARGEIPMTFGEKLDAISASLKEGLSIRAAATRHRVSREYVLRVKSLMRLTVFDRCTNCGRLVTLPCHACATEARKERHKA
jgi:hypothetical protein